MIYGEYKEKKELRVKPEFACDIEDIWRFSLETLLAIVKESQERDRDPTKEHLNVAEIIRKSSVKPPRILVKSNNMIEPVKCIFNETKVGHPNVPEYIV